MADKLLPIGTDLFNYTLRSLVDCGGLDKNWNKLLEKAQQKGVSDEEICLCLGTRFHVSGGASGDLPHRAEYAYASGEYPYHNLKVWIGDLVGYGKPSLEGKKLVEYIRSLYQLPYPGARQLTLFF